MAELNRKNLFNQVPTPFRWYDDPADRNANKFQCREECDYKLLSPQHALLPFMFSRDYQIADIDTWILKDEDNVETELDESLITRVTLQDKDYFIYNGDHFKFLIECGKFYTAEITDTDGRVYYSEKFFVTDSAFCGDDCVNGSFDNDLYKWSVFGTVSWSAGKAHYATGFIFGKSLLQTFPTWSWYKVTFTISGWSGTGSSILQIGSTYVLPITGNGTYTMIGNTQNTGIVYISAAAGLDFYLDDVVVSPVADDTLPCGIGLEWYSPCDFGAFYYQTEFKNRFFFEYEATLDEPAYRITREVTNNGISTPTDQLVKRQKIYTVKGIVPEYIADALADMQIHPKKYLSMPNCKGKEEIRGVTMAIDWEPPNCYGIATIQFFIDEVAETGCCGDNLENCYKPCQSVIKELVGDCVEGTYYLGDNGTLIHCVNGEEVSEPCDTGIAARSSDDPGTCPDQWIWDKDLSAWVEIPAVTTIVPDGFLTGNYRVFARLMPGTKGQLYKSTDGVSYAEEGVIISATVFKEQGLLIKGLTAGTEYWFKVSSFNDNCNYGISCGRHFVPGCIGACFLNVHSDPGSGYVDGNYYEHNADGTVKLYDSAGPSFTYFPCTTFVYNTDLDKNTMWNSVTGFWEPMPSIYSITDDGENVTIKALLVPGSTGKLYQDGVLIATMSAEDLFTTGYTTPLELGVYYDFTVECYTDECNYGTSAPFNYHLDFCTVELEDCFDIFGFDPAQDVWTAIKIDGMQQSITPPVAADDYVALEAALNAIVDGDVTVSLSGTILCITIITASPAGFTIDDITFESNSTDETIVIEFDPPDCV